MHTWVDQDLTQVSTALLMSVKSGQFPQAEGLANEIHYKAPTSNMNFPTFLILNRV